VDSGSRPLYDSRVAPSNPRSGDGDRERGPRREDEPPRAGAPEPQGKERRRWARASADWPISLSLDDGTFEARVRDISQAGVCFFLDRPVPMMTVLRIDLDLPVENGKRMVQGRGVVVRCERISERIEHYEIAVFLDDLAQPDREVLAAYVEKRVGAGRAHSAGE
jgi:hypothetical protein